MVQLTTCSTLSFGSASSAANAAALQAGDSKVVDRAAVALQDFLSERGADRVDLQLDLLWLAAGGDLDGLENGDRLLHADLKSDELALLLTQFLTREQRSDASLWRLFGQRLSVDDAAAAVSKVPGPRHLASFVEANAKPWSARLRNEELAYGWTGA